MAKNEDKAQRELLQSELAALQEKGVIDGDAEQKVCWHYAAPEGEITPEPASGTEPEPENTTAAPQKAPAAAKRGILWYVFRAVGMTLIFTVGLVVISILALFAFAFTGSDEIFSIFWGAGQLFLFIFAAIGLGINAVKSAFNALIEFFLVMPSAFWGVARVFIPVIGGVCCGVYTIVKDKGQAWREASAVLTAAGFALLTWQFSRTYGISGASHGFLTLVLAVSLPLVYIFRSYSLAALYCVFHLRFIDYVVFDGAGWVDGGFLHFLGIAPFIAYYLFFHKPADAGTVVMRHISLIPLIYLLVYFGRDSALAINLFAVAGLLYTVGLYHYETDTGDRIKPPEDNGAGVLRFFLVILAPWFWIFRLARGRSPWMVFGFLSMSGLLATVIIWPDFLRLRSIYRPDAVSVGFRQLGMCLILFAAQVFITSRRPTPLKAAVSFVTLAMLMCCLFRIQPESAVWAAGAALLLVGAAALAEGLKRNNLTKANIGMLHMMTVPIAADFTNLSGDAYLLNSIILLVITVALIVMNLKMGRKSRGGDAGVPEEAGEYGDAGK